jgi:KaiC/GvpD/RAD55 family RecA-like ATPase
MQTAEEETSYMWLEAAKSYEQSLKSKKTSKSSAAQYWQRIGYCYDLASRQAANIKDFRSLRKLSVYSYEKAGNLFAQNPSQENEGRSAYCFAQAEHVRSWLASSPSEKKENLDKCLNFAKKARLVFKASGNNLYLGKTANLFTRSSFERLYISCNGDEKSKLAQEGMNSANEAVSSLLKSDEKEELVLAYSLACIQAWYISTIGKDEEETKSAVEKSATYARKAIELSKEVDNAFFKAMACWAGVWSNLYYAEDSKVSLSYAKEMLKYASTAHDNYLKGIASYLVADATDYKMLSEPNPDKRRQQCEDIISYSKNSIRFLNLVSHDTSIAESYLLPAQTYSTLGSDFAVNRSEKLLYSQKAIEKGKKGLEHASRSGSPEAMMGSLHGLSKAYYYQSRLEQKNDKKRELLQEALQCRKEYIQISTTVFPSNIWILGVGLVYAAQIETDLSRLEKNKKRRIALLKDSITDMDRGISCGKNWTVFSSTPSFIASIAEYQDSLGGIFDEKYQLTAKNTSLKKANETYANAAEDFKQVDLPSRVAESYWKIAKNLDIISDYQKAAENFAKAFAGYKAASIKIHQFSDFFLDYASYMKAWSQIEMAKLSHTNEEYNIAMNYYEKTSQLLRQSKTWMHLSLNFYAWALLEQAEIQSRKENNKESIQTFQNAIKFLQESKRILNIKKNELEKKDEKNLVKRLIKATDARSSYSQGRIAIEEAKILEKQGNPQASSEKYNSAATIFGKLSKTRLEEVSKEARPLFYLCQAWQKMTLAEAKRNPAIYKEAADLFNQANTYSSKESTNLMTLGHSSFCRALEAGTEFETTHNLASYNKAIRHMETATNYYLKAGFPRTSDYAKATQRLFDAYVFMDAAKRERDSDKQAQHYLKAKKVLETAAEIFIKSGHQNKKNSVRQLLKEVKEKRELAISVGEIFSAPAVTASTATFSTLSPNEETAAGLERFEHADIQANLIQKETDINLGESSVIELQMVNIGKEPVSLIQIQNLIPLGFQLINKPDYCTLENEHLNMKGKRLNPLKTEEIKITLKPFKTGSIEIKPKIICTDWTGQKIIHKPQPIVFITHPITLPDRISTGCEELDHLLLGGIPKNSTVAMASPDNEIRRIIVQKFLEAGTKNEEIVFYLTTNPRNGSVLAKKFKSNFHLFICNPRADTTIERSPNTYNLEGVDNLPSIDIALIKAFRKLDNSKVETRRACIEIISDVLLRHNTVVTRKWLSNLLSKLQENGFTILTLIDPLMHNNEQVQAILSLFEGEIHLSEMETEKDVENNLRIRRLKNHRYLNNEITLKKEKLL